LKIKNWKLGNSKGSKGGSKKREKKWNVDDQSDDDLNNWGSPLVGNKDKEWKKKKKGSGIDVLNFGDKRKKKKHRSREERLAEEMKKYKVDDEGYIIGEDGKRILDENGNPMKPEDLILNSSSGGSI